ncbi:hypothetical protein HYH03_002270 [Edaphochlamys debaryana]|uniref:Uncharacterized protein n=1 Tax=Edaphochlamys debaryana TaxID=47281 RepID=A0A835YEY9_9CHLO|nr:hypothetical protein HYH03_002270 [Edaphochlamys debaryana]|eukprot:KAG2499988.1 hypothetical protein HYH03_002270 [Edaphochlamys debaryana]
MAFLDPHHHAAHRHSERLVYDLAPPGHADGANGGGGCVLCVACFLDSLGDPGVTAGRRAYAARQLAECLEEAEAAAAAGGDGGYGGGGGGGGGPAVALLHDLRTEHAPLLAAALAELTSATAEAADGGGVAEALRALCLAVCGAASESASGGADGAAMGATELLLQRAVDVLESLAAAWQNQIQIQIQQHQMQMQQHQAQMQHYSHQQRLRYEPYNPGFQPPPMATLPSPPPPAPPPPPLPLPLLQLVVELTDPVRGPSAAAVAASATARSLAAAPTALAALAAALDEDDGGRSSAWAERCALVLTLLLRAVRSPCHEAAALAAAAGPRLLLRRCVGLARPRLGGGTGAGAGGGGGGGGADLRLGALHLMTALAERGCLLGPQGQPLPGSAPDAAPGSAAGSQQGSARGFPPIGTPNSAELPTQVACATDAGAAEAVRLVVSGLKPCLLDPARPDLAAAAGRLLTALASCSACGGGATAAGGAGAGGGGTAGVAGALIECEAAEYLFEMLRGTAAAAAAAAAGGGGGGAGGGGGGGGGGEALGRAEALTRVGVVALSALAAADGAALARRLPYGTEVLTRLTAAAAAAADHGLAADLTALLRLALEAGGGGAGGGPGGERAPRVALADQRRMVDAVEPLFPRPSAPGPNDRDLLGQEGPPDGGGGGGQGDATAAGLVVAGEAEGPVPLTEPQAACCRGACEVLAGLLRASGASGAGASAAAAGAGGVGGAGGGVAAVLRGPLLAAVGSALRGLSMTEAASLGPPGEDGYLAAACRLAAEAAAGLTCGSGGGGGGGGSGRPPASPGPLRCAAVLLRQWEAWLLPAVDRWYGAAAAAGAAAPQHTLPVLQPALAAAAMLLSAALKGCDPTAAATATAAAASAESDAVAAAGAAAGLASRLLAAGWVQFSFEVMSAAATSAADGSAEAGGADAATADAAAAMHLAVWRLLLLLPMALSILHPGPDPGLELPEAESAAGDASWLSVAATPGLQPADVEGAASLLSGFADAASALHFLAAGGAEQFAADPVTAAAAGGALGCFVCLLRRALAAGDLGWLAAAAAAAAAAGEQDLNPMEEPLPPPPPPLQWLLGMTAAAMADPALQRLWPQVWWQLCGLYAEVEGLWEQEAGAGPEPPPLPPPLLPVLAAALAGGGGGGGPPAALRRSRLPLTVWVLRHGEHLPGVIAAALPSWLGAAGPAVARLATAGPAAVSAAAAPPPAEVIDTAAAVAASPIAAAVATRLLQRCTDAGIAGAAAGGPTAAAATVLLVRLLQLLCLALGHQPGLCSAVLESGCTASVRRLLLDAVGPAAGGADPWAAAAVRWAVAALAQLLAAAAEGVAAAGGGGHDLAAAEAACREVVAEGCAQLGRLSTRLLPAMAAELEAMDAAKGGEGHDDTVTPHLTALRRCVLEAQAQALLLDVACCGRGASSAAAAATLAEAEEPGRAARAMLTAAAEGLAAPSLLLLAAAALHRAASTAAHGGGSGGGDGGGSGVAGLLGSSAAGPLPPLAPLQAALLVSLTAEGAGVRALALHCVWLGLACDEAGLGQQPGMGVVGGQYGGVEGSGMEEGWYGQPGLSAEAVRELALATLSNAAADPSAAVRGPALLGLALLVRDGMLRSLPGGAASAAAAAAAAATAALPPWTTELLRDVISRLCSGGGGDEGFGGGAPWFAAAAAAAADGGDPSKAQSQAAALAAVYAVADLAFLAAVTQAAATAATATATGSGSRALTAALALLRDALGEAQSAADGGGGGDGCGAASGGVEGLLAALLQPPHPALTPLANATLTALAEAGLLKGPITARVRAAVAERAWHAQQANGSGGVGGFGGDCYDDGSGGGGWMAAAAGGGAGILVEIMRLARTVEPAAAALDGGGSGPGGAPLPPPSSALPLPACGCEFFQAHGIGAAMLAWLAGMGTGGAGSGVGSGGGGLGSGADGGGDGELAGPLGRVLVGAGDEAVLRRLDAAAAPQRGGRGGGGGRV